MPQVQKNEEELIHVSEEVLECGCVMSFIPGFGWSTELCEEHEEVSESCKNYSPHISKMRRSNEL